MQVTLQHQTHDRTITGPDLIHDVMGPGYRGMEEDGAGQGEFRTPPLWGIRTTAPYMHDGRAEDLEGAIMAHDGEAVLVRINYTILSEADKAALHSFLFDL